jgi:hypothetical protein
MKRLLAAVLATLCIVAVSPAGVVAQQDDTGSIRIVVNDETGKAPLELARVVLDGPVITSELTDKKGEVLFTDVPDGIYRARVIRRDYQSITSSSFEVINGNYVTVTVTMALSTQLKVIGTVTAKSTASISTSSIGPDSAQRKLSSDLVDALSKLSGVSVQTSSDDSDAETTISLEGHDASQTALTLDGIPLNAPGAAGNIGAFATDLFTGASVRNGPQLGGLGGGVNFTTLEPTLSWESYGSLGTGTNGRYNYSFAETGSDGKLGIAVETVGRENTSWLTGLKYLDASGLDYVHDGDSDITGQFIKLRYELSDSQSISGMFLSSARSTDIVCARLQYDDIPCGYGPNNYSAGSIGLYSLTDDALIGATSLQGSIYSIGSTSLNDELARYVNGVPSPSGSSGLTSTDGFTLNAILPAAARHTISVQAQGSWSTNQSFPLTVSGIPYYTNAQHSNYSSLQVVDSIHSNQHLTLSESFGFSQSTFGYGGVLENFAATWHPDKSDTYQASYAMSGSAAASSRSTLLSDPAALRYTCDGDDSVAFGNAPGESPSSSSSTSARVGYTRTFKGGNMTVQLYRQSQLDVLLPTNVNGTILVNNGTLSPAYLTAVQQIFQSPAGCGANVPFSPAQLYYSTPIAGVQRVYEGGSVTGYATVGNLVIQPFWDTTVSKAISNSIYLNNPYSITISGQQLPNVPLQRAGLVLDYKAPHSSLEWLADAEYTGNNNSNNLPAYTSYDAAANVLLNAGSLTFTVSNFTNTDSGIFSSTKGAVPYYTVNGSIVPTIARPLTPRSYLVTYSVKFGPGALGHTQLDRSTSSRGGGRYGGGGGAGGPGGGGPGGGGAGGGGGFRGLITPLPTSPPENPLDVSSNGEVCPSDAHATALTLSTELKAYVAQIEAAKTAAGYPATMPAPPITDATVTYHGMGEAYALTIVPHFQSAQGGTLASQELQNAAARAQQTSGTATRTGAAGGRGGAFRVFFGCLPLHTAQPADITSRHLYAPASGIFAAPQITFMPAVGLYVEQRPQQAGQESFRVYALPSVPPKNPFEVRTAPECTGDLRNTATEALGELQKYFANGAKASLWTISPHVAKSGTWYDLTPGDPAIVGALLFCGRVAAAVPQDVVGKGWDGMMVPELNYNASYGLYLIRPQPPQQPRQPNAAASPGP